MVMIFLVPTISCLLIWTGVLMGDIEYARAVYSLFIPPVTAILVLACWMHTR